MIVCMIEIIIIIVSFILSLLLVLGTKRMSISFGVHDIPNGRKIHTEQIPTLGGLGIFIAVWVTMIIMDIVGVIEFNTIIFRIFTISITMFIMGIIDDVRGLSAKQKFTVQIIAGGTFFLWNNANTIIVFSNPILSAMIFTLISMLLFTIMTNSVNFIDGLDGLCAGVSIIFSIALFIFASHIGNEYVRLLNLVMIGALLGFSIFNFYPAKIFMGDTGSLFLGGIFTMNAIVLVYRSPDKWISFIMLFSYLFIELSLTVLRRIIKGNRMFSADKMHIHHILKGEKRDQRPAVITIYLINIVFCFLSVMYFMTSNIIILFVYIVYVIVLSLVFFNKMLKLREST